MTTVLFACVQNAGRSQIAAALFNRYADGSRARAVSAGTRPAAQIHPNVVALMRESGVDLSERVPQRLTEQLAAGAQWLITMGCGDACPVLPGTEREDWAIEDPHGQPPAQVNAIIAEIDGRVRRLIDANGWR